MRILFLCTELTGYFANCIQLLHNEYQAQVRVVCWPNTSDAPFEHNLAGIEVINKRTLSENDLRESCLSLAPSIVYVAGWVDGDYNRLAKSLKKRGAIVVCGLDNAWIGSVRQHFACLLNRIVIKPRYSYLWVSGRRQYQFAKHLGFSYNHILSGLYSADVGRFTSIANNVFEKYLIYVGRFEKTKGVDILYKVFSSLTTEEKRGWKLKMIGNGSLKATLKPSNDIEIYDFMQPDELIDFIAGAGGFILPSIFEPWGVVVQEFAAAGKPLLLSDAVNSGEEYLIHNYNGFKFKNDNFSSLKETVLVYFNLSDDERLLMGKRSAQLAMRGEPKYWTAKLVSLVSKEPIDTNKS